MCVLADFRGEASIIVVMTLLPFISPSIGSCCLLQTINAGQTEKHNVNVIAQQENIEKAAQSGEIKERLSKSELLTLLRY